MDVLELSPKELDYMARTLVAEAGGDPMNQAAVGHVIRNRALHGGFGQGVEGVITKPYAFEPWLHAGKGKGNDPLAYAADDPKYLQAVKIAQAVAAGEIPDPTHGATHFYSPQAQKQLAAIDNRALVPGWVKPEAMTAKIGGHEFYNLAGQTPAGKKVINVTRNAPENADWFERAYDTHYGQGQASAQAPAPVEWFDKAYQTHFGEQPAPTLPQSPVQPPPDWGALQSATTGLTLGAWPYIQAGVQTLGDYTEGKVKEPSTLVTGEPTGWSGAFKKNLENVQGQRAKYQEYAPISHMLAEQGGALLGTALPIGAAERGIALGGKALGEAVPALRSGLEAAGRFVSGRAAEGAPGFLGGVGRAGSYAAQGAGQGAGQALFTQGLQPEGEPVGSQLLYGAGGGALMSSMVNPLASRLIAPLTAEIAPNVRALAQDVNQKFGLNLRPTQVARDAEVNALDRQVIPQHVADAQVVKFNEELAKQIGMGGKELTKDNVQAEMRKVGDALSNIASTSKMRVTRDVGQALGDIRADVYATTLDGNPLRQKVDGILLKLYNEVVAGGGELPGVKFRDFVKKGGLLDKELLATTDPSAKMLGYDLKRKMFEMFEVSDPVKAGLYNQARQTYRKLVAIEPLANASGIVNPQAVLKRAQRQNLSGDIKTLGEAGQFVPKTTSTGSARLPPKPPAFEQIKDLGRNAIPAIPSAAAYMLNAPPGAIAAAGMLLGGGQYLGGKMRDWAMGSPIVGRAVLSGKVPDVITPSENLLARGAANVTTQVGAGSERKKRK